MTSRMVDGTSIDEQPQIASSRLEVGHWEGDTVVGKRNGREAVILTLLEKNTALPRDPHSRKDQRGGQCGDAEAP